MEKVEDEEEGTVDEEDKEEGKGGRGEAEKGMKTILKRKK